MRRSCLVALLSISVFAQEPAALSPGQFREDFAAFVAEVNATYAYFDVKATRWEAVAASYDRDLSRVRTRQEFIELLELAIAELYDDHAHLTVNLARSPRLVPSGADIWAEWVDGQAVIVDVRHGSAAERAGVRAGAAVISFNGTSITEAVARTIGRTVPKDTAAARNWALRRVLAGRHGEARLIEADFQGRRHRFDLPAEDSGTGADHSPIAFRRIDREIGYIRFNDSLGDDATVGEFDRALAALRDTRGLVIDLRETPGGGNSTIARGVLGRFVASELPYQKHVDPSEKRVRGVRRSWLELVSPRGPFRYSRNVVVLVGRWTGSMAEGLAIGFDGVGRGTTVGGPMAQLLGATYRFELPNSKIGVSVPAERLYHVNGTAREAYQPTVAVGAGPSAGDDVVLQAGVRTLLQRARRRDPR